MGKSQFRVGIGRSIIVLIIVCGIVLGGVLSHAPAAARTDGPILAAGRCGVVVEPFPVPPGMSAKRPTIVTTSYSDAVYAGVTLIDPAYRDSGLARVRGAGLPTVWLARPWRPEWQGWYPIANAPLDAYYHTMSLTAISVLADGIDPTVHGDAAIADRFDAILAAMVYDQTALYTQLFFPFQRDTDDYLSPPALDDGPGGGRFFGGGFFVWEPRVVALSPEGESWYPAILVLMREVTFPTTSGHGAWGYAYGPTYFGDAAGPELFRWLLHETKPGSLVEASVRAPLEPPAVVRMATGEVVSALTEERADGVRQVTLWQFDRTAIERPPSSVWGMRETRPSWRRWAAIPVLPDNPTGWSSNPSLASAGRTILVTFRDGQERPVLAWTTVDDPTQWHVMRLADHVADGRIHIVADLPRHRYLAAWAQRGPTRAENQLVITHGLLTNPATHTPPVAITTPGPWFDPMLAVTPAGTVHLAADFVPADEPAVPQLLTLPAQWESPREIPMQPIDARWRQGRLRWQADAHPPAAGATTIHLRHSRETLTFGAQTATEILIPMNPLLPGDTLVSGTWDGCDELPLGSVTVAPPPVVTYERAEWSLAGENPVLATVRLVAARSSHPVQIRLRVELRDALGQNHTGIADVPLSPLDGDVTGSMDLTNLGPLPDGAATIVLNGVVRDSFGQLAVTVPDDRAMLHYQQSVVYTGFAPTTVRIPLVLR